MAAQMLLAQRPFVGAPTVRGASRQIVYSKDPFTSTPSTAPTDEDVVGCAPRVLLLGRMPDRHAT